MAPRDFANNNSMRTTILPNTLTSWSVLILKLSGLDLGVFTARSRVQLASRRALRPRDSRSTIMRCNSGQQCGSTGSTCGIHASHSLQRARGGGGGGGGTIKNGKEAKKDVVEELVTRIADQSSFRANLRPTELPSPCE